MRPYGIRLTMFGKLSNKHKPKRKLAPIFVFEPYKLFCLLFVSTKSKSQDRHDDELTQPKRRRTTRTRSTT